MLELVQRIRLHGQEEPAHPVRGLQEPALGRGPRPHRGYQRARPPGPTHHQGRHRTRVDLLHRRETDRSDPPHRHPSRPQERRGRLRHHLRRPRRGTADHPRRLGPRTLGDREPAALGPRRHLRRGPLPSPHRQQPARDGHPAQHRDQPAPTCRLDQHRRRPTTSRQTPRRHRPTGPELLKRDFAGALGGHRGRVA